MVSYKRALDISFSLSSASLFCHGGSRDYDIGADSWLCAVVARLGEGSTSEVFAGQWHNQLTAVKVMKEGTSSQDFLNVSILPSPVLALAQCCAPTSLHHNPERLTCKRSCSA